MNKKLIEAQKNAEDVKLAEMPLEPSADFTRRVLEACAGNYVERKLCEMPIEPSADFTRNVMAEITVEAPTLIAFPLRFKRAMRVLRFSAAGIVALASIGIFFSFSGTHPKNSLNEQIASVLDSDPELAEMVSADDEFSFNELLAVSQLLTTLNKNSEQASDFFAYYEN
ncbi:MAG: hypothetical protein IKM45_00265 [Opitutales bacterium]|nr:hypothetical protein [Opitutales bacterium]